jgi:tetratricopeptide (TPR) repeat protein
MDDLSTSTPWIDDWMVENTIHAIYALESVLGLDAVDCFKAHLIQTHFGIAIQVLRNKVSSLIMEPVIDWDACHLTFYQTYYAFMVLSRSERLLVLEVFYDLAVYARKNIDFSFTSQMNGRFSLLLWCYCCMLRQVACPSDALAITEDAVRYNLSQTTPETDEVDWLGLQALVLSDMGRFAEAETVLHDAKKRWNSPNPHWLLTVVESSILRQTGRVDQALLLLENSTSSIAKSASDTTPSDTWFIYFLFSDLSSTQLDVGQTQNALETAKRAVVKCRELHFSYPHKLRPRLAVAYALTTLSNCLAAVGRSDAGLAEAREAVTIYAGLPWRQFCPVGYRPEEFSSKAFHTLSLRLAASGHPDEALINAEKAVEEYRELVSLAIRYTPSLADGLRNLALRLWDVDRCDESIRALKEAISILQGVADQLPMAHHLPALADALELLAEHLPMQGDAAGASAAVFECFDIRGRLAHSAVSAEGEELHIEKVRDIGEVGCGTRFEMKIELKSSPLDVVWWILVAALGLVCAGLALALARK